MVDPTRDTRIAIDRSALRDKVNVVDPTAAPLETDSEAAGASHPRAAGDTEAEQRQAAQRNVPELDVNRTGTTSNEPWAERQRARTYGAIGAALAGMLVIVAGLLWLTM
jgi:hypothetical protein